MYKRSKMFRHTLNIWQQMLQDFKIVSDHFGTLYTKGLKKYDIQLLHMIQREKHFTQRRRKVYETFLR